MSIQTELKGYGAVLKNFLEYENQKENYFRHIKMSLCGGVIVLLTTISFLLKF